MRIIAESFELFVDCFQFDSTSNECFVSDETSDVAVPSTTLDIFEPFCVPRKDENTCNRPYSFEKMITTKLMNSSIIKEIQSEI